MNKYEVKKFVDKNGVKTIIVLSRYAGRVVKGVAKCNPEDTYDEAYGIELATKRCDAKVAKKRLENANKKLAGAVYEYSIASKKLAKYRKYVLDATVAYEDRFTD